MIFFSPKLKFLIFPKTRANLKEIFFLDCCLWSPFSLIYDFKCDCWSRTKSMCINLLIQWFCAINKFVKLILQIDSSTCLIKLWYNWTVTDRTFAMLDWLSGILRDLRTKFWALIRFQICIFLWERQLTEPYSHPSFGDCRHLPIANFADHLVRVALFRTTSIQSNSYWQCWIIATACASHKATCTYYLVLSTMCNVYLMLMCITYCNSELRVNTT